MMVPNISFQLMILPEICLLFNRDDLNALLRQQGELWRKDEGFTL